MQIECFPVSDEQDLKKCFDIRHQAFVEEQNVPHMIESDGLDRGARHFAVSKDGEIIATCRVRLIGSTAKVERVAVLRDYRSLGIGKVLMKYILQELPRETDISLFKLSSQSYAVPFYEKLGFRTHGSEYMEAGMPHYEMVLER